MKRLLMCAALACIFSSHAMAGDVPTVGTPQPPPPAGGPNGMTSEAPGGIPTDGLTDQISSDALSALMTMLTSLAV